MRSILVSAVLFSAALAHADALTSDQLAAAARTTSPLVAQRTAEAAAAAAAVDQARAQYLPHLGLTARYVRLSDISPAPFGNIVVATDGTVGALTSSTPLASVPLAFPVYLNSETFSAQLDIPISDDLLRVSRQVAAANHAEDAARYTLDAETRKAVADARVVYYAWARARLSAEVAANAVHEADLHADDVGQRVAAERANRADLMAVQAQRAAAEQLRVKADDLARVYEAQVRIVLRTAAPPDLTLGEDVSTDLALTTPGTDDALLADAIGKRPELRAAGANVESLAEQARATWATALPKLDVVGDLTDANPNQRFVPPEDTFHTTWSVGAQVTWQIGDAPTALAAARQVRARRDAATAQRAQLIDALHVEVAQAASQVRDAQSAQVTAAQGLASAEESYRVRRALFREGAATSTELSDAETELTRARLDAVAARIDARIAAVRIAHATGRD
jgi:outer membrane protein TolC